MTIVGDLKNDKVLRTDRESERERTRTRETTKDERKQKTKDDTKENQKTGWTQVFRLSKWKKNRATQVDLLKSSQREF